MVKLLFLEDIANFGDHGDDIFGLYFPMGILDLFMKEIESIVAIFTAVSLFSCEHPQETFVFTGVQILDRIYCELSDKFDPVVIVYEGIYFL